MERRTALRLCGATLVASVAGCLGESDSPLEEAVDELAVEASFGGMVFQENEELTLSQEDDVWTGTYEASIEQRDTYPDERDEVVESLTENYGPDFEITTEFDGPEVRIDVTGDVTRQQSAVEAFLESLVGLDSVETEPEPEDCISKFTTYTVHGWTDGTERIDARRDTCDTDLWIVDIDGDRRATLDGELNHLVSRLFPG